MTVKITNHLDVAAVQKLLASPTGGVAKNMLKRGYKVQAQAKMNLNSSPRRINTGNLRSSIQVVLFMQNGKPAVRVGTNVKYAIYVHEGTGLYGPHHKYIVPVNKKVLRWKTRSPKGKMSKNGYTYAMKSSGMKPNPFLRNALKAAKL